MSCFIIDDNNLLETYVVEKAHLLSDDRTSKDTQVSTLEHNDKQLAGDSNESAVTYPSAWIPFIQVPFLLNSFRPAHDFANTFLKKYVPLKTAAPLHSQSSPSIAQNFPFAVEGE